MIILSFGIFNYCIWFLKILLFQCCLWGFRFGTTDFGNPYRALMVESLHQCDQGIFVHMFECIKEQLAKNKLLILDSRLQIITKQYWISGLRLPGPTFFSSEKNIQGHEYRAIMQVHIF